jgi:HD-GYP domain-containing protein (c-di-GMP phosphodiesterase class II)
MCKKNCNILAVLKEELRDILKVNHILSSSVDLKKISSLITRLTCGLMHVDSCILALKDEGDNDFAVLSSFGSRISKKSVKRGRPVLKGFKSYLCSPVVFQRKTLGFISVHSRKKRQFNKEEKEALKIFASQLAIAIQETRQSQDNHKNYFNTIHALVLAIETKDPFMRGHTERVTRYAVALGRAMQISQKELEILRFAAQVHDVGKISVSDFILRKPGRLSPAERAEIEMHPVKGVDVLEPLDFLRPALPIVRHHHERYDGTGYPDGLEREKIPFLARILACADSFDAMISDRPYRQRRLTVEEALVEIKNNVGSQFDPRIANLFIKIMQKQPE